MKRLVILIFTAALVWSAFWLWSWHSRSTAVEDWFADRTDSGWTARYNDLGIRGFPNRLDTRLTEIELQDPATGVGWQAPFFEVLALSYQPGHVIAVWPETQVLTVDRQSHRITSEGLRASLVYDTGTGVVDRSNLEAQVLNISGPGGSTALAGLNAALMTVEGQETTYRLGLTAKGFARSRKGLTAEMLPGSLAELRADAVVTFDQPWTTGALGSTRPQPTRIDLKLVEYKLGKLELKLAGDVRVDALGRLDGALTVKAVNWREMVTRLREAGEIPLSLADALEDGLALIAALSGNQRTLDLPLKFQGGKVSLGPVPLGEAPRIRLP